MALFHINSILDAMDFSKSNDNIKRLILYIISEESPKHELILKTTFQFFFDAYNELLISPELIDNTILFILQYV